MTCGRRAARRAAASAAAGAAMACLPGGGDRRARGPATAGEAMDAAIAAAGGGIFADVTRPAGIEFVQVLGDGKLDNIVEAVGCGGCVLDFDGDGRLDVYLVNQGWHAGISSGEDPKVPVKNRLYRNRGNFAFEDVTDRAGVGDEGFGFGAVAGDFDGDGRTDLYVLNSGPNRLYRNRGDGTFEDVTAKAGVGDPKCSVAGCAFDADGDGDLDLYVGNYLAFDIEYRQYYSPDGFPPPLAYPAQTDTLYLNRGDGTFEDATKSSGIADIPPGRAMGVAPFDADGDGDTDLYVANDASAKFLLINDGKGHFVDRARESSVAFGFYGEATASMAGVIGDADGDGLPDLLVIDSSTGSFFRNLGKGRFQDRVRASGYSQHAAAWAHWGGGFLDFDNDGDLDIYAGAADLHYMTGRTDLLLENDGSAVYSDAADRGGPYFRQNRVSRGGILADLDDDGRTDIVVVNLEDRPAVLRNVRSTGNHWIALDLRGAPPHRDALGAKVVLEAGGRTWVRFHQFPYGYLTQQDPREHFGLGAAAVVDRITITWPDGTTERHEKVAADRVVRVAQKGGLK